MQPPRRRSVISFLDLQHGYAELKPQIDAAVSRVLWSGRYIGGYEVDAFEAEWADYCDAAYCAGTGNGIDALILALRACGIKPGDGVVVPSNTYIGTWLAVSALGAVPQAVEPDPFTYTIDSASIARAITPETRAMVPVHLYGQPADLDAVLKVARQHDLFVIEDAAQAHGARYKGRRIGAHGDAACWSFYPSKNLGAMGDAGAVTTNNRDIADVVRRLGNYGSSRKYVNSERGVNSRLDPLQAAILRVKLTYLDEWNERRRTIAATYDDVLADTGFTLPNSAAETEPVWHHYVIRSVNRNAVQARLRDAGIETLIHYPIPPHMQTAYADLQLQADALPIAKQLSTEILSLPIGPHLSPNVAYQIRSVSLG